MTEAKAKKPVDPQDHSHIPDPLTVEEVNAMIPDSIPPGALGWIKLDAEGKPTGEVTTEHPQFGEAAARVVVVAKVETADLTTPSGAPITPVMNPSPLTLMDPAFLERNPPGGTPKPGKSAQTGTSTPASHPDPTAPVLKK